MSLIIWGKAMDNEIMIKLTEFKNTKLLVYTVSVFGYQKPSLWIQHSGKNIKLGSFIDIERAKLFVDYFLERGLPVEFFDEGEEKYTKEE